MPELNHLKHLDQNAVRILAVTQGETRVMELPTTAVQRTVPAYEGETTVTPGNEPQTLETQGKLLNDNIVIHPIPQNYGLITWNGAILTVS